MRLIYKYETKIGVFYIGQSNDGRFHPIFDDENLGSYSKAWQATEDLAGGHTFSISNGMDNALLDIPEHPSDWEQLTTNQ